MCLVLDISEFENLQKNLKTSTRLSVARGGESVAKHDLFVALRTCHSFPAASVCANRTYLYPSFSRSCLLPVTFSHMALSAYGPGSLAAPSHPLHRVRRRSLSLQLDARSSTFATIS